MSTFKEIIQGYNMFGKVFSGGVDNEPVTKEEVGHCALLIDLIERTYDEDMRGILSKALRVSEKRLVWRIQHSHELSIDRYKVNAASFLFAAATVFMFLVGLSLPMCNRLILLVICLVLILVAICILRSRHKLWEDYYSALH